MLVDKIVYVSWVGHERQLERGKISWFTALVRLLRKITTILTLCLAFLLENEFGLGDNTFCRFIL